MVSEGSESVQETLHRVSGTQATEGTFGVTDRDRDPKTPVDPPTIWGGSGSLGGPRRRRLVKVRLGTPRT